jgi:hypothetical protein
MRPKKRGPGGRPRRHILAQTKQNKDTRDHQEWSRQVKERDGFKCQWPNCSCKTTLQSHHIRRHANYPTLRHDINNGITLCKFHHKMVNGKEEAYASLFLTILHQNEVKKNERKDV